MTISDLEKMEAPFLTPRQVAGCLCCDPQLIRNMAENNPSGLGFTVQKSGAAFRISRIEFLNWIRGSHTQTAPQPPHPTPAQEAAP